VYVRVSTYKQKDDLKRQRDYMSKRFPDHEIVSDVGSGINWKRKGLLSILERAQKGLVQEVVVSNRDRLCRIGFELLEWLLVSNGAKLVVLEQSNLSKDEEFVQDILAIIHVYSCRQNGRRRYKSNIKNEKDQIRIDITAEKNISQVE
jgi:predicted site-specific integrase-resolvase